MTHKIHSRHAHAEFLASEYGVGVGAWDYQPVDTHEAKKISAMGSNRAYLRMLRRWRRSDTEEALERAKRFLNRHGSFARDYQKAYWEKTRDKRSALTDKESLDLFKKMFRQRKSTVTKRRR